MPSIPRYVLPKRRGDGPELSTALRTLLLSGIGDGAHPFARFRGDEALTLTELKAAWKLHGDSLSREYAESHPGRRPWAWWLFTGKSKYGEPPIIDKAIERQWVESDRRFGLLIGQTYQEPEAEFLHRVGEVDNVEYRRYVEWLKTDYRTIQRARHEQWLREREQLTSGL